MRCRIDPALDLQRTIVDDREPMRRGKPKKVLPLGKLPLEHLRSLLKHLPKHDQRLLIGPQIGEDAAVIDAGDRYLVVATDPVTFATDQIGRYAVHVNANDVAVLGALPLWFFVVMLLPESGTTPELAETIMADVRTTCDELGVTLAGGHTEITQGLDRPILVGQMLGEVAPTRLVRKTRISAGDLVLLTRGVAIEGTAILARAKFEQLQGRVGATFLKRAARFLVEPGISVVSAALAAANVGEVVHAMHDPTEGGIAAGLFELVAPAGLGLRVMRDHIPVFPETASLCSALGLDPLKLIASGALLIAVAPDGAAAVLASIEAIGVPATVIGEVRPSSEGVMIVSDGRLEPLIVPLRDEIARTLERGHKQPKVRARGGKS
ncbi:MAG TPA: AIR synthase family protein [Terriglobales bacterium]|nr:AIR synthase family protein [Terriglobales bacterium]